MARAILTYPGKREANAFDCRASMRHIPPMRLGYFTMPLHPPYRDPAQTLQEDREAIVLADRLGFHDAFVGEHLTDHCENVTSSLIFLATLIGETKTIKLATGTSNLSQSHPVVIAAQAAMFDHLAKGRFIFGISPGALSSDAEALGILAEDRNKMLAEAIDVILAIWERDPPSPYRFYWKQLREKMMRAKRHVIFKMHEAEDDGAVTIERLLGSLVICGTVNRVVDELLALRERSGEFGEIVYAGMDWVDEKLARRSMELMAAEVMPQLDRAIGARGEKPLREAAGR